MNGYIFLNFYSLIFLLIQSAIFFRKKRAHELEDNTYSYILVSTIITDIIGIINSLLFYIETPCGTFLFELCGKLYLFSMFLIFYFFVCYTFIITNKKSNLIKTISRLFAFLISIFIIVLPLTIKMENGSILISGFSSDFAYIAYGFCYVIMSINTIFASRKNKKFIPILLFIFLGIFLLLIQTYIGNVNYFINPMIALIVTVMYHTIENPDMKMIEQLNIARDQADKANKAKSDFLSSMSHEIRTPLNAIVGFSEAVKASSTLDEAIENANDIVEASQTLLEIVNGVLDISKIESGKLEIVNSNYNAHELFLNVSKLMQHKASEKALEYIVEIAPDIPNNLYGDYASIKKVITNLLSNAVKYTEKGYVRYSVNCVKKDDICRLIISVEDSGRGIKESQINKLFDKFQRLDEDKNTTIEGTGLGLAITKRLVELMNGQIVVQSKYGEGSKFTVTLDQRISVNQVIKTEEHIQNDDIDIHNKKILVVDDNTLNLKVASKVLESFTTNITLVDSGFECINKLNEGNTYDVILLDDMMPKLSGKETLIKLKEMNISIPIVALTANAISGEREKYIEAGFDEYLAKPIDKKELERVLKKVISQNKVETDEVVIIEENI